MLKQHQLPAHLLQHPGKPTEQGCALAMCLSLSWPVTRSFLCFDANIRFDQGQEKQLCEKMRGANHLPNRLCLHGQNMHSAWLPSFSSLLKNGGSSTH